MREASRLSCGERSSDQLSFTPFIEIHSRQLYLDQNNICSLYYEFINASLHKTTGNCEIIPYPCRNSKCIGLLKQFRCYPCGHRHFLTDADTCKKYVRGDYCIKCDPRHCDPICSDCDACHFLNHGYNCTALTDLLTFFTARS